MTDTSSNNIIIIKYCLPLSVVSFIIFLCGFFLDGIFKTSLWAAAVFSILVCLIIYCYTTEQITNQNRNQIKNLSFKSEKLSKLHYKLHLVNPKSELKEKVNFALDLLSESIPNRIFVCFYCNNNDLTYLTGTRVNSLKKIEKISSEDPLVLDISNRIKTLTDCESLREAGGLDKPIRLSQGNNVNGQIMSVDFYSNFYALMIELGKEKLSDLENEILLEFCKSLALIFEDDERYKNNIAIKPKANKPNSDSDLLNNQLFNSMIPDDFSTLSGWKLAKHFVPSSKRADFMDILNLTTDKQMILLGKCSGYGLNAALYVSRLKLIIRCFIEEFQSPAKLLNKISRYLNSDLMPDIFIDLTAITFSASDSQVTLAMAGSTIPIINRTRSGFAEIPELQTGIPLGLFNQGTEPYKDQYLNLMPGDGILLHTDGITDFPGKGLERISNEDLKIILDKIPEQNADDMLNSIVRQIKNQNINELPEEDHSIIYLKAE